jgi:hypothetical protein
MSIYDTWKPRTYYILENKTSGKKYIGQTIQDINKYLGSGSYWINHCKKHGGYNRDNISIVYSEMYETKESAQDFLDDFKILNVDYWERDNKIWANLCEENTNDSPLTGGEIQRTNNLKRVADGTHHLLGGEHARQRVKDGTHHLLGGKHARQRVKDGTHNFLDGENARQRVKDGTHHLLGGEIQGIASRQRVKDGTHNLLGGGELARKNNLKRVADGTHHLLGGENARQRVADGTHHFLNPPTHTCPYCNKEGKGGAMFRFHFDNCKLK